LGCLSNLDALEATGLEVCSFFDIESSFVENAKLPLDSDFDSAYRDFA
jgi:hypothetical protein